MKFLVQRQFSQHEAETQAPPTPASPTLSTATWPLVVWVKDGPVCVSIVDEPSPGWRSGVCHCGACRGSREADWAESFLP